MSLGRESLFWAWPAAGAPRSVPGSAPVLGLTFEQQRELLILQFEQEKLRLRVEMEGKIN